ncbi:MAG: ATPase, T2SS/T4P/T4SS family [Candidatus Altiarchaeota archaeon]
MANATTDEKELKDVIERKQVGETTQKENPEDKRNEIERYKIYLDDLSLEVKIVDADDYVLHYEISLPKIDYVTKALLDEVKRSLIGEIEVETRTVLDPEKFKELKLRILDKSKEKLKHVLKKLSEEEIILLSRVLVNDMLGLGEIEYLIADPKLEEIVVNSSKEVIWVYHKTRGWLKTNLQIPSEEQIANYSARVAREVGREITNLEPLLDAHLITGDRFNATLFPISTSGNTITIRRFSRVPWTIIHLISPEIRTISIEAAAFLWLAIEYELSILITGGTASGKTVMLNALLPFMPANQRIITMEDTRELNLPKYMHWVPLTTRPPTPRGEGEVSLLELMQNSLRMRPDRIIVGEVRAKEETEVMFEAMHTGHSCYGTFHALNAQEVIDRITSPPMNIPPIVTSSLHLIVTQHLNRRSGIRRTLEIVELIKPESGELPELNLLYRYNPRNDKVEKVNASERVREELELFTGMSESEMLLDIEGKKKVLEWLLRKNIKEVDDVGKIITQYYVDKEAFLDIVEHDKDLGI